MKKFYSQLPKDAVGSLVERIKEGVRTRRYAPGQRLIEADLAAEHRSRRGPVREALRILAGDGIVELVPRKGARVRRLLAADMAALLPLLSAMLQLTLKLSLPLLPGSGRVDDLDLAMDDMRRAAKLADGYRFHRAGLDYTATLRRIADNPYLDYLDGKLHAELFYPQASDAMPISDWQAHLDEFESLHRSIVAGDLVEALRLVELQEREMWLRVTQR